MIITLPVTGVFTTNSYFLIDSVAMPKDTVLYPGHGQATTVRHEKNTNPYFQMFSE